MMLKSNEQHTFIFLIRITETVYHTKSKTSCNQKNPLEHSIQLLGFFCWDTEENKTVKNVFDYLLLSYLPNKDLLTTYYVPSSTLCQ